MSRIIIECNDIVKYSSDVNAQAILHGTESSYNPKKKDFEQNVSISSIKESIPNEKGTPFFYRKRFHEMSRKKRLEIFVREYAHEVMRTFQLQTCGVSFEIRLVGEPNNFTKVYTNSKGFIPMNTMYNVEIVFEDSEKDLMEIFA